jgi:hypothetical protein
MTEEVFNKVLKIIMAIGIPAIIGGGIYIGKKLQILNILEQTNKAIKHNIKIICDTLIDSPNIEFDHKKLESYSPLRLTGEGQEYLKQVGFVKIFDQHAQDFFDFIDSEEPKTKYDVEVSAVKSVLVLSNKEYFRNIKIYLYQHPNEGDIRGFAKIAGIYIRDKYLERHSEITE